MHFLTIFKQQQNQQQKNTHIHKKSSRIRCSSVAILICLLANGISKTNAVPTDSGVGVGGGGINNGGGIVLNAAVHSLLLHRAIRDVAAASSLVHVESKDAVVPVAAPAALASTETTTLEQPQGQCLLDGVLVTGTSVLCEKQVGCRAIQKTGHCCPDYKCDCEKDGKTYLNGDKLVDPETPCTVCYCQGGEILCSSVTCFHRDDCTPKYIVGRCCPEYDNCPVSKFKPNTIINTTAATTPEDFAKPKIPQSMLNSNITIKEITKPTEIRITDENKAIPIHQMLKPSTTTTTTTTTTEAPSSTTTAPSSISTTPAATAATIVQDINNESSALIASAQSSTDNNSNIKKAFALPNVGINESLKLSASVAYPSTEQPGIRAATSIALIAASPSLPSVDASLEDFDEVAAAKQQAAAANVHADKPISVFGSTQSLQGVSDSANDPSKVNIKREYLITTEDGAVLSSAAPAIEDFNPAELIYGNSKTHQVPSEAVNSGSGGAGGVSLQHTSIDLEPDTAGSDNIYHIILTTDGPRFGSTTESYMILQHPAASSTEGPLYSNAAPQHLPSTNDNGDEARIEAVSIPQSTTEGPSTVASTSESTPAELESLSSSTTSSPIESWSPLSFSTTEVTQSSSLQSSTTIDYGKSTTESIQHHVEDEETAMPSESNPAYPSLPGDDFSLRDVNVNFETDDNTETELKDEQRSIAYDALKSTKHLDEPNHSNRSYNVIEGSGGNDVGLMHDVYSTSEANYYEGSSSTTESTPPPPSILRAKVPLMYSAEDISAETAISNSSDFQLEKIMRGAENDTGDTGSGAGAGSDFIQQPSLEALMAGSGSGSGEIVGANTGTTAQQKKAKQREPTTARPTRKSATVVDIDELGDAIASGDGSGKSEPIEDPKLDVESLKVDENQEAGVTQQDAAVKGDVLNVKTYNPAEEKAIEDTPGIGSLAAKLQTIQRLYLQSFI